MANFRISTDLLAMLITALLFTVIGVVTGACLALILIELITTRGHVTE